ncbi:MAG: hypothetical protein ABIO42_00555, partial [Burkholderiaceae bacterium]
MTILTYCAHPALAYGTLLVFKTLRVGFPTARVEVYDNGSHPDVVGQIGARQGSCRLCHAANGCISSSRVAIATTESRSGFSVTAPMGVQ